ncbi:MAG: FAD-dependent monooxygenase [Pseudonocardiaceae bacterium]
MKVIINGAGIAGLSLAQRLTTTGWDATVIERASWWARRPRGAVERDPAGRHRLRCRW